MGRASNHGGKKWRASGRIGILAGAFLSLHAPLQSRQKSLNWSGLSSALEKWKKSDFWIFSFFLKNSFWKSDPVQTPTLRPVGGAAGRRRRKRARPRVRMAGTGNSLGKFKLISALAARLVSGPCLISCPT